MTTPVFSILMAAYQSEATIARAVKSVRAQRFQEWELIIVDDGSTDSSAQIARDVAGGDPRITILFRENGGQSAARNTGAEIARGTYICALDADDEYRPEYLERMYALTQRYPGCKLFSCNAELVNPSGKRSLWRIGREFDRVRHFDLATLCRRNDIFIMAVLDANIFRELGGFEPELAGCEDYDLWLRVLAAGHRHVYTPEALAVYYRLAGSSSSSPIKEAIIIIKVMDRVLARPGLTSEVAKVAQARQRTARARLLLENARTGQIERLTRTQAIESTRAFGARWRRAVALPFAAIAPDRYLALFVSRRNQQLEKLYSKPS